MITKKHNKKLFLIRHGKADAFAPNKTDKDRPLEHVGKEETIRLLKKCDELTDVDLIITSSANRAFETALEIAKAINYPALDVVAKARLYLADEYALLDEIAQLPDTYKTVIVVAHNPGLTELANYFVEDFVSNIPTSGIVGLEFKLKSWKNIHKASCKRPLCVLPKRIGNSYPIN